MDEGRAAYGVAEGISGDGTVAVNLAATSKIEREGASPPLFFVWIFGLLHFDIRELDPIAPPRGVIDQQLAHRGRVADERFKSVLDKKLLGLWHARYLCEPGGIFVDNRLRRAGRNQNAPPW